MSLRFALAALVLVMGQALAPPVAAQSRVALVVGNAAYAHATPLANPVNDAQDVARALTALGFEVILGLDLDRRGVDERLRTFTRALGRADTALFFYAGHGLQVSGQNWLIPVDAKLEGERDLEFEAVRLDFVLRQMELEREGRTNIVFLDACRDNPLARNLARTMGTRSASVGSGLAQVQTGVGTFISYSTQPGNVALDGSGRNSPFSDALVKRMAEPGRPLTGVMVDVRKDVLAATQGRQVPWDHSALTAEFYFQLAGGTALPGRPGGNAVVPGQSEGLQDRVRQLEQDLKRRDATASAAAAASLAQLKSRLREIDDAIRQDRDRLFDVQRKTGQESNPQARSSLQQEIGKIHLQMGRRGQERRQIQEELEKLEAQVGASPAATQAN